MTAHLKLFDSIADARKACDSSSIKERLEILPHKSGCYIKRPQRANKEPEFLCKDGRWRRYDLIKEFELPLPK